MITLMAYAVCGAAVIDHAARELAADARLAMKRADLTLDYVARATGVPHSRLSDQLNGKTRSPPCGGSSSGRCATPISASSFWNCRRRAWIGFSCGPTSARSSRASTNS